VSVFNGFVLLLFSYYFCFPFVDPYFSFSFAEEMLPLTGAEMRKYVAELEKSKNPEGYVASDPAGLSLRKLKRKESGSKRDAGIIEVDDAEGAGDANALVLADSPVTKKSRTGKGSKVGGRPSTSTEIGGTSLNDEAVESFWHSEFNFRRYASISFCLLCVS
jgi:hypothetical protein